MSVHLHLGSEVARRPLPVLPIVALLLIAVSAVKAEEAVSFAPLAPLPNPQIVAAAEEYPGGSFSAVRVFDGNADSAYATNGKGTETFLEFDFGAPTRIAAFEHLDRNDPATVAESQLTFFGPDGAVLATVPMVHVNRRGGRSVAAWPEPIDARRVRWQVTKLGSPHSTVGAAEITFYTAGEGEALPARIGLNARAVGIVEKRPGGAVQPLRLTVDYPYGQTASVTLRVTGQEPRSLDLSFGTQTVEYAIPALDAPLPLEVALDYQGKPLLTKSFTVAPRKTTIYVLPHSHTDIGYTEIQTEIEDKQVNNLLLGMRYAEQTADYPPGARFVWNVEVLWAADLYLNRLDDSQRAAFLDAVRGGRVALCGMYLNELTGLCRPEELLRLFRFATELRRATGATIDSAMISDVPGYTWGTVPAMAQAGIQYFSVAPNYFDRIGDILVEWENKPFYWAGPSEHDKVLVWIPYKGYAMSHVYRQLTPEFVEQYEEQLDRTDYPYEIAYMRWAGHGDNAVPDPAICEFIRDWNATHEWPRFVISSVGQAFGALEERHGEQLPTVRGDWTPYWEDGAGSSSLETAMNRQSSDRLTQAETLWALSRPASYPAADFARAWRDLLLYSEHTWGAWCSVREPARKETLEQWSIKQSYATSADRQSRDLLSRALALRQEASDGSAIDVFNSCSWQRTELVVVPKFLSERRNRVIDADGNPVPSQRLRAGELAFLARDVPPLAAKRYQLEEGAAHAESGLTVGGTKLDNGLVSVELDPASGAIAELRAKGVAANLIDTASGQGANDYLYLIGDNAEEVQRSGPATIEVKENGPLVGSLLVRSDAPGCRMLEREVRLVAGLDRVELVNLVDKARLEAASYHAAEGKESLNFAFPWNVPGGQLRYDVPFGVVRPDADQIPSACKNWLTVGRWADVSSADRGVTWVTLDAPLVQAGRLTATLLNSQADPRVWLKEIGPTQRFYSWAMNNHWGTNYRAFQEGPVVFRYVVRPHGPLDLAEASRLAIGASQPLLATAAQGPKPSGTPRLAVDSPDVLVTGLKPSDDGRALIVRLWAGGGKDASVRLKWSDPAPRSVWRSDLSEQPLAPLDGPLDVPAWGLVTLRAELSE